LVGGAGPKAENCERGVGGLVTGRSFPADSAASTRFPRASSNEIRNGLRLTTVRLPSGAVIVIRLPPRLTAAPASVAATSAIVAVSAVAIVLRVGIVPRVSRKLAGPVID
jgi:hypothetical protein